METKQKKRVCDTRVIIRFENASYPIMKLLYADARTLTHTNTHTTYTGSWLFNVY